MDPFRREQRNIAGKYFILPNWLPALSAAPKTNWNNVIQRVKIMDAAATVISGLTVNKMCFEQQTPGCLHSDSHVHTRKVMN